MRAESAPANGAWAPSSDHTSLLVPDALIDELARRVVHLIDEQAPPIAEPGWLDADDAAAYLACPRGRIYDLVAARRLRCAREGRRVLFRHAWLDAVVEVDA